MYTTVYMVRHAESPFSLENERTRGLSADGWEAAEIVKGILLDEGIEAFVSSPYTRAVQTIELAAEALGMDIEIYEDLRERPLAGLDVVIEDGNFMPAIEKAFIDKDFALQGGESNNEAEKRGVAAFKQVLYKYKGKKVAVGTHGNIMTFIMGYFDGDYGTIDFWKNTSKPDIYKMTFDGHELLSIERLWR